MFRMKIKFTYKLYLLQISASVYWSVLALRQLFGFEFDVIIENYDELLTRPRKDCFRLN